MCLIMLSFSNIYLSFLFLHTTYNLTRPDLICIDPFSKDYDSLSSQVSSTSDTHLHVHPICTHNSESIDTLLSSTPESSFSSTTSQALYEIVDPPLCQSTRIHKSTKPLDFTYSCYSSSFTSLFTFFFSLYSLSV